MLINIHIKNMALIDEIDIPFSDNLNILTGETGAGKSILIDSVMIALGGKAPKDFVRADADFGLVELLFSVDNEDVLSSLKELEIPDIEDGEIIISRTINDGRSICKANGMTITVSKLRQIAALLIDLHAQHENQSLLDKKQHIKLLDRYGKNTIDPIKQQVKEIYEEYSSIKKELDANNMDEEEKKRKLDLLLFEKNEIESAKLKEGEDEELERQYEKALHGKNITESLGIANNNLSGNVTDALDRAIRELTSVASFDEKLQSIADTLQTASDLVGETVRSSREYIEENSFSEEEFTILENRLNLINHLKAKYGKTISDINNYYNDLTQTYDKISNQEQYLDDLKSKLKDVSDKLDKLCDSLTKCRKETAALLSDRIKQSLTDLNFLDVRFDMCFEECEGYTEEGKDIAYFIISTNVGEEMKPLNEVASGGELSRIMLAMKACLASVDRVSTLVFDEIDTGISGRTAQMVAEKINYISRNHQVICITHLPQIAAMADHHYMIEKNVIDNKTITSIQKLDKDQEITELARLLGGAEITDTVISSAKEMKELASKAKVD